MADETYKDGIPTTRDELSQLKMKALWAIVKDKDLEYPDTPKKDDLIDAILAAQVDEPEAKQEMSDEDKVAAFNKALETNPEAVVVPARQLLYRVEHPKLKGDTFEISAVNFTEQETTHYETDIEKMWTRHRPWKRPVEDREKRQGSRPHTTSLSNVPDWARAQVYDLVLSKDLKLYPSEKEVADSDPTEEDREVVQILDVVTGDLNMEIVYGEGRGVNDRNRPVIVEPRGDFSEAEQDAAWNVLNSTTNSEAPLPQGNGVVAEDPKDVTQMEIRHVRDRIERCLEDPKRFTQREYKGGAFRQRIFFNQLLECEYKGFTPQRAPGLNKLGGTRPGVLLAIRELARQHGFEVRGDYVVRANDVELETKDVMPTRPVTDIPEIQRRAPYKTYDEA